MFVNRSELNEQSLERTFQGCFLPSFDSFGQAVSEEKIFQKSTNQKQEWPVVAMFVNRSGKMTNLYKGSSIDATYQMSVHLGKRFQRRRFFQKSTNQKQEQPVAAMFVNGSELKEQSLQRTFQGCFLPSFDSFGQAVSEKICQKSINQKQEWPVAAMFVNGSGKMTNLYRGSSIDATYQMSVHLGKRFQRRRFFRNQPIKNKNGLWQQCLLTDRN